MWQQMLLMLMSLHCTIDAITTVLLPAFLCCYQLIVTCCLLTLSLFVIVVAATIDAVPFLMLSSSLYFAKMTKQKITVFSVISLRLNCAKKTNTV